MTFQFHSAWRRFAAFLVEHPRLVMGLMAASVGAALVFVPFLQFDFTPQAIYRGDDELVGFSEEFKRTFGYDEAVVLVVLEARGAEDVLNAGALQWQKDIACQLAAIPRVRSVDSLATLQVPRLTMSGLRLASLVPGRVDEVSAEKA